MNWRQLLMWWRYSDAAQEQRGLEERALLAIEAARLVLERHADEAERELRHRG